jgi:hypothetical protein
MYIYDLFRAIGKQTAPLPAANRARRIDMYSCVDNGECYWNKQTSKGDSRAVL